MSFFRVRNIGASAVVVCLLLGVNRFVHAQEESVDELLLDELEAELLGPIAIQPTIQPTAQSTTEETTEETTGATKSLRQGQLDEQLLDELAEDFGEDLGEKLVPGEDWISKVVRAMKTAQSLLEQPEVANSASSAQADALTGLDAMIAELTERKSKCKGGACKKPGQPKPGKKKGKSGKAGKKAAEDSAPPTSSDADLSTDLAVAGELVKDLWGKLPERQREQILQPLSEEFLPKYAREIEAYYRALADPKHRPGTP